MDQSVISWLRDDKMILLCVPNNWSYMCCDQGPKNRFFRPIFRRKIGFRWWWKRFSGGKIFCKKIGKKSAKIADFSEKIRYFPEKIRFFPKKSDFSRYLCKLYFRSLREEILKNGANQSCRIKKKCTFGKNNSCLVH